MNESYLPLIVPFEAYKPDKGQKENSSLSLFPIKADRKNKDPG
jgi:hypothetical protein